VIGAPHADLGEGVVAVLVARAGEVPLADIQRVLDARLAKFKHPRRFFWIDALPRNAMGKVEKAALRAKHAGVFVQ